MQASAISFPPPQFVALVTAMAVLWFVEYRAFYWPLPVDRNRHARVNLTLNVINLLVLGAISGGTALLSFWVYDHRLGLMNWLGFPLFWETLIGAIAYDLGNYWIHRSQHQVPFLWRLHRAHHTDPYIDTTSAYRFHPFESIYRGVCFALIVLVFGISPMALIAYGVAASIVLPLSHANLNIPFRWERWSQYGVVLPLHHRVHHSIIRSEHDSNYGIVLLWWDHIFGSYLSPSTVKDLKIGLPNVERARATEVLQILKEPFR
jgi:sterol desaturase/sphingolipid hydroxylase (fatty acid hydroxylase superfamily)